MYFGAEHLIGFFTVVPSAQWYSYLGRERGRERKDRDGGRMGRWMKGKERKMKGEEKREMWMNGKM